MIDWPKPLIDDLQAHRVVIFIGSGVSQNSVGRDNTTRPQTWLAFLTNAAKQTGVQATIDPYLQRSDFLTALDLIRHNLSRDSYARLIRKEYLDPGYGHAPIHEEIFKLDANIVLSPNFDKIYDIYAATVSRGTVLTKNYYDADLSDYIRGDLKVIIKTHGTVDLVANMIFGRKDYAESRVKYNWFHSIIKALAMTHTFVFVGCGTDDPDIRLVLEDVNFAFGSAREHYFISAAGYIEAGFKTIMQKTMNLQILEYEVPTPGNHSDLTSSLRDLNSKLTWNV